MLVVVEHVPFSENQSFFLPPLPPPLAAFFSRPSSLLPPPTIQQCSPHSLQSLSSLPPPSKAYLQTLQLAPPNLSRYTILSSALEPSLTSPSSASLPRSPGSPQKVLTTSLLSRPPTLVVTLCQCPFQTVAMFLYLCFLSQRGSWRLRQDLHGMDGQDPSWNQSSTVPC